MMELPINQEVNAFEPSGCEQCDNTGYKGRIGIYEIMTVTPKLKTLIAKGVGADELKVAAQAEGMHTLRDSAVKLVLDGVTSNNEMLRTTFEN